MRTILSLALMATASVGTPAFAQVMTPSEYVMTAGASDLFERQSSELVLSSTMNPDVKAFADMMLTQHSQSTANVKAAAVASKLKVFPPKLTAPQMEMVAQLEAEKGPARDALYIAQQRAAHGQALSVQQAYSREGTAPRLRATAEKIVPVVEHHIEMLRAM